MAELRTVLSQTRVGPPPSLLRMTVVALILALGFDAVSTALAWNVVRALPGTDRRAPVHAVRSGEVKDLSQRTADSPLTDHSIQ